MKYKSVFVFFIAIFLGYCSGEEENKIDKNIKYEHCTDQDTGKEYRVGDIWTASSQCLGKNCGQTSQGNYTIGYISCPKYTLPAGCFMGLETLGKNYPICCPQPECDKVFYCPIYQIPSGCYLSAGDLREKFPRCCPQPQCPKVLAITK